MTPKDKFYKVYANLPLGLRNEVVAVIDSQPVSWLVAKLVAIFLLYILNIRQYLARFGKIW